MKYCKRCLYPTNHPLNILIGSDGICSGCKVHEEKDQLDWIERGKRLEALLTSYRSDNSNRFDCVVPVSGARDSFFIVDTLIKKYCIKPLLVNYNRHYNTQRGIRNLAALRTVFDCDFLQQTVRPAVVKQIMRETLQRRGSFHWHVLAGQSAFAVQVAVRLKVPLIIWGVHQGCDQVGMFSHMDEVEMTRKYRKEHDLLGLEAESLIGGSEGLNEQDLIPFYYPDDKEIARTGVRGIYLSNYIRWDSKAQHDKMINAHGYETANQARTFDTYNDVDCIHYSGAHDYIKFLKWGFGKVTDHACREIRLRRLSRNQGRELVRQFQNKCPTDLPTLLNFMEISHDAFVGCVDKYRDSRVWQRDHEGNWQLKHSVVNDTEDHLAKSVQLDLKEPISEWTITLSKNPGANESEYTLMHRGWADQYE